MSGKVLIIVLDQLRADCVFGKFAEVVSMPNVQRLMREGVAFHRHYTVTVPCGPARASLLTGRYAMNHRSIRNGTPLAGHLSNLAIEARKLNYEPLLFGYTDTSADPYEHHPEDPALKSYEGLMKGFVEVTQLRLDTSYPWIADLKAKGYDLPGDYWQTYEAGEIDGKPSPITGPALYRAEDSDTAFLAGEALKALSVREKSDWFASVNFIRPHPPLVAPAPYNTMYDPVALPKADLPADFDHHRTSHPFIEAFFSAPADRGLYIGFDGRYDRLTESHIAALRAVYFGLASEVDAHIGRLLDYLEMSGQADQTLVVLTADHGEMLGDKHMWGKTSIYEPAYHIPLIIRDPRRRHMAGKVVADFTESIDLLPTIIDWMGANPSHEFDGRSLLPFVEGKVPQGWRDYAFAEMDFGDPVEPTRFQRHLGTHSTASNCAILREARFKLVHFNAGLPPILFDLENDPLESTNLAADPAFQGELYRLTAKMLDHRMRHADQSRALMMLTERGAMTGRRW